MIVEWTTLAAVAAVFLFAGFVKGIVAIGLPAISISLLSHIIGVREAVFITLAPAFLTSVAQAVAGPALVPSIKRLWPLLVVGAIAIFAVSRIAVQGNPRLMAGMVGSLIALYAAASLLKFRLPHPGANEKFWSPAIGLVGGVLGGMSGMFAIPGVPYIQSLRLDRETMIQSIAIWFTVGALVMMLALGVQAAFTPKIITMSAVAVVTSLIGIWFGTKARGKMSDGLFLNVFYVAFLLMGSFIVWKAISGNM
jgi:uncharacterized membrane protein YfcA